MQDAFGTLIWVVAGGGVIVGLITLVLTGRTYSQIGGGGVVQDDEADAALPESAAQREEEIRQHVIARNARRVRAGEQPLDVEQEVQRRIDELA